MSMRQYMKIVESSVKDDKPQANENLQPSAGSSGYWTPRKSVKTEDLEPYQGQPDSPQSNRDPREYDNNTPDEVDEGLGQDIKSMLIAALSHLDDGAGEWYPGKETKNAEVYTGVYAKQGVLVTATLNKDKSWKVALQKRDEKKPFWTEEGNLPSVIPTWMSFPKAVNDVMKRARTSRKAEREKQGQQEPEQQRRNYEMPAAHGYNQQQQPAYGQQAMVPRHQMPVGRRPAGYDDF